MSIPVTRRDDLDGAPAPPEGRLQKTPGAGSRNDDEQPREQASGPPAGPSAVTGRVIGVDLGRRRVGVAVSDSERRVASALVVLARGPSHQKDHAELAYVVAETGANLMVVGLPLSLSGRAGPAAKEVEEEVAELRRVLPIPVELCDERYSTVVADRSLRAGGRKTLERRQVVDKVAAAGILQTWLDRQRNAQSILT